MLMTLAKGKVAVCLEVRIAFLREADPANAIQGGYNLRSISKSALAVTRTLMGEPPDRIEENAPTRKAVDVVQRVKLVQSRYWSCLYPKSKYPPLRRRPQLNFHRTGQCIFPRRTITW